MAISSKYHQSLKLNYTNDLYGLALKKGDCIFLTGSCPLPTPKILYEKLLQQFNGDSSFCSYNTGMPALKGEIVKYIKEKSGVDIDAQKRLLITLGATTFLQQLFIYLVDDESECLVITPTFQDYFNQIRVTRSKITEVPMTETDKSWEVDFVKIKNAITPKTKVILLCSPNNPTGKIYSEDELKEFCRLAKENNIFLVIDEAYNYLVYNRNFVSPLSYPEYADNVIIARTFSKEFGMCGWRVGYAIVPESIKDELFHFQLSFNSVPAAISQMAAYISLNTPEIRENVSREIEKTKEKRDYVIKRIHEMGKDLSIITPDACVYLYVKYQKNIPSYEFCKDIIEKEGVIVSPGIGNGEVGEGHFCITFADSMGILEEGLNRLGKYFKKYY